MTIEISNWQSVEHWNKYVVFVVEVDREDESGGLDNLRRGFNTLEEALEYTKTRVPRFCCQILDTEKGVFMTVADYESGWPEYQRNLEWEQI
jgi:hypothetical protein